jgi:hypothetical protein
MEDQFKNTLFAFILVGLFGMLIITSVVTIGNTYGKNTTEIAGGSLSLNKFNQSISNVEQSAKNLKTTFESGSIWSAVAGVVVEGVFGVAKNMVAMILFPFTLVSDIMSDVLHIPTFVTSVILGLLLLGLIFGIWALIKVGN